MITIRVPPIVEAQIAALDASDRRRVENALRRLRGQPLLGKPLQGPLRGRRSVRAGRSIRIVYAFDPDRQVLDVLRVAHRRDVYR